MNGCFVVMKCTYCSPKLHNCVLNEYAFSPKINRNKDIYVIYYEYLVEMA